MKYGWILACILALGASGCATKKFVQNSLDPVSQRVSTLEAQNQEQSSDIEDLDTAVSDVNELAQTADRKAEEAGEAAEAADARAGEAGQSAADAASMASSGLDAVGNRIDALSNYQLVTQESVVFGLSSSELTDDARLVLDQVAASVRSDAPFVIEVLGFTDTSGDAASNLALSDRRAKEVVRYLAGQHNIPLRQIQMLGLGSERPSADNSTREGREQNRRVEVKVYAAGD